MAVERFTLETLSKIDGGRIREAFEQALLRCQHDCQDRPALGDARKIQLDITMTPLLDYAGDLESCNLQFQIKDSVPKRKSKVYNMKAARGALLFNELSPDDVHQRTLDEATGPKEITDAG